MGRRRSRKTKCDFSEDQECGYHLCKYKGQTTQCPYCRGYFCQEHLAPTPPSVINISHASYEQLQNWRREDTHPCYAYVEEYERRKEEEREQAKLALDMLKLAERPRKREPYEEFAREDFKRDDYRDDHQKHADSQYKPYEQKYEEPKSNLTGTIKHWFRKVMELILFPFFWLGGTLVVLLDFLIMKPARWIYEEINSFCYHLAKGIEHATNALWALFKILIFLAVAYGVLTYLYSSDILPKLADSVGGFWTSFYSYKNCNIRINELNGDIQDIIINHNECSTNKPWYCNDGNLIKKPNVCGCGGGYRSNGTDCIWNITCTDGTFSGECSKNKPYYCNNGGQLLPNSERCGCSNDYMQDDNDCKKIQRCEDGTIYGECTLEKPFYCLSGTLIEKASECGCPSDLINSGERCISKFEYGPINRTFTWGANPTSPLSIILYTGIYDYYAEQPKSYSYYGQLASNWETEYWNMFISEPIQDETLISIVDYVKSNIGDEDEQARALLSFVASMPYDYTKMNDLTAQANYPYETLFLNRGVCMDKSLLGTALLKELGYGVALFEYEEEDHMAVGIKCPAQYALYGSDYCFVEVSRGPVHITKIPDEYYGGIILHSKPLIIPVSDGKTLESIEKDIDEIKQYDYWVLRTDELKEKMAQTYDTYAYNNYVYEYNSLIGKINEFNGISEEGS